MSMLKTLIGDYPVTRQFRTRTDRFEFAQYQGSVASAFKRVVRNLEFDVAEMAIMTFLVAEGVQQNPSSAAVRCHGALPASVSGDDPGSFAERPSKGSASVCAHTR